MQETEPAAYYLGRLQLESKWHESVLWFIYFKWNMMGPSTGRICAGRARRGNASGRGVSGVTWVQSSDQILSCKQPGSAICMDITAVKGRLLNWMNEEWLFFIGTLSVLRYLLVFLSWKKMCSSTKKADGVDYKGRKSYWNRGSLTENVSNPEGADNISSDISSHWWLGNVSTVSQAERVKVIHTAHSVIPWHLSTGPTSTQEAK